MASGNDWIEPNNARRSALKLKNKALKRRISRVDKLVKLYKKLRKEITNLENREVSFGEDYDEDLEQHYNVRLQKLTQRQLQIHDYFVRKGIFVNDAGEALVQDVRPKLVITTTGIEDLNTILTEFVNQGTDSEVFGHKTRLPYRHVTVDDVKMLICKVKEASDTQLFPDDPSEFDRLVQNIACEVNRMVKLFIENDHQRSLADWMALDQLGENENASSNSAAAGDTEHKGEYSLNVPTWDTANMELHEACGRGELDCPEPENSGDDTEMAPTVEEKEEEDEEEDGGRSSESLDDNRISADFESDDSCCIIGERVHERCQKSDDNDDGFMIENEDEAMSDEEIIEDDIESVDTDQADNGLEKGMKDMEKNEKADDEDDDDCRIIDD